MSKSIVMESIMYDADKRREENRRKNTGTKSMWMCIQMQVNAKNE